MISIDVTIPFSESERMNSKPRHMYCSTILIVDQVMARGGDAR
ncbi:MAG: hypothetical protein WKG01_33110 [Kofleriaceae bacterium]